MSSTIVTAPSPTTSHPVHVVRIALITLAVMVLLAAAFVVGWISAPDSPSPAPQAAATATAAGTCHVGPC